MMIKRLFLLSFILLFSFCDSTVQHNIKSNSNNVLNQAQPDCVFCKIIVRKAPATIIAENNDVIVFKSHSGHPLIVPKKHIKDLRQMTAEDSDIWFKMLQAAQALSANSEKPGDFQLIINTGSQAGQTVFHLHAHYISKSKLLTQSIQI